MSQRYKGGIISATPPTTSTSSATGSWTLEQQFQAQGAGTWPAQPVINYIEDVFGTYTYTGTGTTQTISNGVNLSTYGGLVWLKYRSGSAASTYHHVYDSARGKSGNTSYNYLYTNTTSPQGTGAFGPTSFNSNGFTLNDYLNESTIPYVSWTFRKQAKFFDVVTYTGNGGTQQQIAHNLQAYPGLIIVKRTDSAGSWYVCPIMQSNWNNDYLVLNSSAAKVASADIWQGTSASSNTTFGVLDGATVNVSGATYVAYLFAASGSGGFGLAGTDDVIATGSYTGTGALQTITLGFEPQWIMIKKTNAIDDWYIFDSIRGFVVCPVSGNLPTGDADAALRADTAGAEQVDTWGIDPYPTGFTVRGNNVSPSATTWIYVAIRRGPMKTPTSATQVFTPVAYTGTSVTNTLTGFGFTPSVCFGKERSGANDPFVVDQLRGRAQGLYPDSVSTEVTTTTTTDDLVSFNMDGITMGAPQQLGINRSGITNVLWNFKRAPKFFDEVCYIGNATAGTNIPHNLGVVPEMIILKGRSASIGWPTYHTALGNTGGLYLNLTTNPSPINWWNNTTPTSSVFTLGSSTGNNSGATLVAYLFATLAGVSKVGSYTGTGTLTTINCGFTGGARFVMIKRYDSASNWFIWDSARGMVAGTDPSLSMNTSSVESNANSVYTITTGFQLLASPSADVNTSGGTYIYLAIA